MVDHEEDGEETSVTGATEVGHLRQLVRHHHICWEKRTEHAAVAGELRTVGFVIELTATHDRPHREPVSGCPECAPPLRALEQIVTFVLPKDPRESTYDVHVHWGGLQYARRRQNRPEVRATISIVHTQGADRPVDPCEERCLHEIIGKLGALGACEGAWSAPPSLG